MKKFKLNAIVHTLITIGYLTWFFTNQEFISKLETGIVSFLAMNDDGKIIQLSISLTLMFLMIFPIVVIFLFYGFFRSWLSNDKESIMLYGYAIGVIIFCVFFGSITIKFLWNDEINAFFSS